MKTTDWRWNGSLLGVPVRRHNHWHINVLRGAFKFQTAESPRWFLKVLLLRVCYWPRGKGGLEVWFRD